MTTNTEFRDVVLELDAVGLDVRQRHNESLHDLPGWLDGEWVRPEQVR